MSLYLARGRPTSPTRDIAGSQFDFVKISFRQYHQTEFFKK